MRKAILFILGAFLGTINFNVVGQKVAGNNMLNLTEQEYLYVFTEATKYYIFGNYVQAVSLYNECLKIKPASGTVHFQLAKIYLNSGNNEKAEIHARLAEKYSGNNVWIIRELGDLYQMLQKNDSAIILYNELLKYDSNDINVLYTLATLYEKEDNTEKSLEYLKKIDNLIGQSKEVCLSRFRIFENKGLLKEAANQLKSAERLTDDYSITGMLAEFYRRHNMSDSAAKYYKRIFPKYRSETVVTFSYIDYLLSNNNKDSATILLAEVMKDTTISYLDKTNYFYRIIQNDEELKNAKDIIDTVVGIYYMEYPNDIRSMSVYADIKLRYKKYQEAINVLKKIVGYDSENYAAVEQLIYCLNILGKSDSVNYYAERALISMKDKPLLYLFNGSAYYQNKQYEKGISTLKAGLNTVKDDKIKLEFYSLIGECYQGLKKFSESEEAFSYALIIEPDNLGILNNYAYYLSLREINLKKAEEMSKVTIKKEPENSTYLDTYAWVLFKMGKGKKAKKFINDALRFGGSDNKEILKHSAEINSHLKNYKAAILSLEALKKVSNSEIEIKEIEERIVNLSKLAER